MNISRRQNPHNHYRGGWDGCLHYQSFFHESVANEGVEFLDLR